MKLICKSGVRLWFGAFHGGVQPPPRAGAGGDRSSELDVSAYDRGNLFELEEELDSPSRVARVDPSSSRIPRQPPTNFKLSSSRPTLYGVISTSHGLICSVVTPTPP
ncbi:hypothetical protein FRC15_010134 [Serendipita sp. 397]|nr:hypothetical protein FRC15_010134 [Serendipita sp. 397]